MVQASQARLAALSARDSPSASAMTQASLSAVKGSCASYSAVITLRTHQGLQALAARVDVGIVAHLGGPAAICSQQMRGRGPAHRCRGRRVMPRSRVHCQAAAPCESDRQCEQPPIILGRPGGGEAEDLHRGAGLISLPDVVLGAGLAVCCEQHLQQACCCAVEHLLHATRDIWAPRHAQELHGCSGNIQQLLA